ncbi:septum formation initiator family protein [Streptomyces sp. MB22_4]|uniref:septum formation initiator family protein n=1 Tax=Streptomyces sp. MB22_4 TaxID=3383120 RepID=UPI0039A14482
MPRNPELRGRAARLARLFPAGRAKAARTPFVLLVVLLLGGGLIGLLVLNSALSAGSFELADLQKQTKNLTDEEQALQRDIDAYSSPDALQRRARDLGMVPGGDPAFLDPNGTVKGVPGAATPEAAALDGLPAPESLTLTPPPGLPATPTPARQSPSAAPRPGASRPDGATPAAPAPAATTQNTPPRTTPQSAPTPTPGR